MLKTSRLIAAALFFLAAFASAAPSWAASPFEALLERASVRFLLSETVEGSKLGELVLSRPVRSEADVQAFLTRVDREQFKAMARDLEVRLRQIDEQLPVEGEIPAEARAALLRDAAGRSLSFTVNPKGEIEFVDMLTARGSLRANSEAFMHPDVDAELERFNGRMLRVHRIPVELTDSDWQVNVREVFGPGESVVLGVSEKGDFALAVGNDRYAGTILRDPLITQHPDGVKMGKGLLLRFNDLTPESVAKLREGISPVGQSVTLSCVNAACMKLGKAGIRLGGPSELPIYRSDALQRILDLGFESAPGKPVRYDIFMNSERTVEDFFNRMQSKDKASQRLLKMAQSKGEVTVENLMKQIGLTEASMDGDTHSRFLMMVEKGVPTLLAIPVPVVAVAPH